MINQNMPEHIEVYDLFGRRLYVKLSGSGFALFEDELTPEELTAIAEDISLRKGPASPEPQPRELA